MTALKILSLLWLLAVLITASQIGRVQSPSVAMIITLAPIAFFWTVGVIGHFVICAVRITKSLRGETWRDLDGNYIEGRVDGVVTALLSFVGFGVMHFMCGTILFIVAGFCYSVMWWEGNLG